MRMEDDATTTRARTEMILPWKDDILITLASYSPRHIRLVDTRCPHVEISNALP
jgi:hypothetical protein